jgi:hypothetical protein
MGDLSPSTRLCYDLINLQESRDGGQLYRTTHTIKLDCTSSTASLSISASRLCCDVANGRCRAMAQARVFGRFAAHSMAGRVDDLDVGFNFELFTHTARFFDFKVRDGVHVVGLTLSHLRTRRGEGRAGEDGSHSFQNDTAIISWA